MKTIYLDHASTTKLRDEVFEEMIPYLTTMYENPSSLYDQAIKNKKTINQSRAKVAECINACPKEIYFCSGGSEANNWAIKGAAFNSDGRTEIITTNIEHHSQTHSCEFLAKLGFTIKRVDVDDKGFVNLSHLESLINDNTLLVSIIMANNEIGTIQDIKSISQICKKHNVIFHTDAVQAVGHLPIDVKELGIDLMSVSAHKFYGPKGVGCLYVRKGIEIENLIHGGKQEFGKRSGTENVANIVGMAKALEIAVKEIEEHASKEIELAKFLWNELKRATNDIKLNGPNIGQNRLSGNLNLSFKDQDGSLLSFQLNEQGIYVSTGSACNAGSIEPSHVLQSIGVDDDYINGTIRITLGKDTTKDELLKASQMIIDLISK